MVSTVTDSATVMQMEITTDIQSGRPKDRMAEKPTKAPNTMKPSKAQLVKLYTLYTSA